MKQKKNNFYVPYIAALVCMLSLQWGCGSTKTAADASAGSNGEIASAITSNNWIFTATQAMPMRGRSQNLTTTYQVTCNKDTVVSYLPYVGRAYTAQIGESKSPLDFQSTDFSIDKSQDNKGRWIVNVKPNDYREVQLLNFTFFDNGSAQLSVQFTGRDPISFNGRVEIKK
ncbi:MAG TPA: DUF4251 domain-containing protein [Agriterribacter sp.]|nr:DUF4251 domain-containing protein [Agriterribacter sp.]